MARPIKRLHAEPQIPAHTEDDDLPVEMAASEELVNTQHMGSDPLTHHPHIHMIAPGGGVSLDGQRWVSCRRCFFLPVRALSRLFRRLFLEQLMATHGAGRLQFFGPHAALAERDVFEGYLKPLRTTEWVVYAKRPFGGPEAVLDYLACYTHRVAISNSRLIALNKTSVTFKWKDYRIDGNDRYKTMTLDAHEFIRRFLMHVLPSGFHRIRHYGLFAGGVRARNIARARVLLAAPPAQEEHARANDDNETETAPSRPCACCGGRMIVIEKFKRGRHPRGFSVNDLWIDTS